MKIPAWTFEEGILIFWNIIDVSSWYGTESCICIREYFPYGINWNIFWEVTIESVNHFLSSGKIRWNAVKMGTEEDSMNTGICSSGTNGRDSFSKYCAESFIQDLLNCDWVGLDLPAVIGGPFIWDKYEVSGFHDCVYDEELSSPPRGIRVKLRSLKRFYKLD